MKEISFQFIALNIFHWELLMLKEIIEFHFNVFTYSIK